MICIIFIIINKHFNIVIAIVKVNFPFKFSRFLQIFIGTDTQNYFIKIFQNFECVLNNYNQIIHFNFNIMDFRKVSINFSRFQYIFNLKSFVKN